MKRITIMTLLIMAFVSFATVSFADNSPPGVEISTSYELPEGVEITIENQVAQVWQAIEMNTEGRIAVYDCDLKCWPGIDNSINYNLNNIARVNSIYDDALFWTTESERILYKNSLHNILSTSNRDRLSVNTDEDYEVLSLFYNSSVFAIA